MIFDKLFYRLLSTIVIMLHTSISIAEVTSNKEALEFFKSVRCVVCESQSIAESHSEFAQDIRAIVIEKLNQGESKQNIEKFLIDKYGDSILFSTPINQYTILLWIAPILVFIFGVLIIIKASNSQ